MQDILFNSKAINLSQAQPRHCFLLSLFKFKHIHFEIQKTKIKIQTSVKDLFFSELQF